jgi:thioredoxin reductase
MHMKHDVIVVVGSFAGLAAATYLARGRRNVCVIARNRLVDASHGFLGHDGDDPRHILSAARRQLFVYPTVHAIDGEATEASIDGAGFSVTLLSGETLPHAHSRIRLA